MAIKKIALQYKDATLNIALDTISKKKQALVFVNTKRSAEKTAEDISKKIKVSEEIHIELSKRILKAVGSPTKQCRRLADCISKGIAFHHAGLTAKQRELVEDAFRSGHVQIICSTPTLASGVDLPAFRTIIRDLKRYGSRGMMPIPVLEYLQMAGRAGRPSYDSFGEAICLSGTDAEKESIYEKYIMGEPEDIFSKLAVEPVLRTYLLSLVASRFLRSKKQIMEFFEKTFWAKQFKDMAKLEAGIEKMLMLLEEWEFLKSMREEFASADELDNTQYRATILGKRVAELYLDPLTAHELIVGLKNAMSMRVVDLSWLQLVSQRLEMRPLLNVRVKEWDDLQDTLARVEDRLLFKEPALYEEDYDEFMRSIKTAMFFQDWIDEKNEEYLLEAYAIRPGEIRVKLGIADWLFYSCEELCKILEFRKLLRDISKMRLRLKYGIKDELFPLIKLRNIGRVRARKLFGNGITDVGKLKKFSEIGLGQLLGRGTAKKIKEQLGQTEGAVKKGTRKGQLSIKKFK